LHNFCFSRYEFEINIKPFLFQLAKKTTHKTDGKSAPTYDDDYETGGGSTVYKRNSFFFLVKILVFSSYNGPYTESSNDVVGLSSEYNMTPTFSRTNSLKKQHVHWPDVSTTAKNDNLHSILTESPSAHRRLTNSTLSHFIQTAIIPAGSTVSSTGTSQFLIPTKDFTSVSAGFNSVM